jgi:type III secretion protein J
VTHPAIPGARWGALALVAFAAAGCGVSVAAELDEGRANRVVALLDANGIAAERSADPAEPGRFRVDVASDDAARAVGILAEEGPSSRQAPGMLEALGTSSLVPSPEAEHERVLTGIAGELTQSLESVDGVLSARVHLGARREGPLAEGEPVPPTAAVLLRYRGATPPIRDGEIRKLVAFAVPGLAPERVAVVFSQAAPPRASRELVRLGPVSTTRATARKVRGAILFVLVLNLALGASLVALWTRLRRARANAPDLSKPRATR